MAQPTRPVPTEQQRNFETALAERLDIDPHLWSLNTWSVEGDEPSRGKVTLDYFLDGAELLEMFNTGQTEHRSLRTRLQSTADSLCACDGAGCDETYARRVLLDLLAAPDGA